MKKIVLTIFLVSLFFTAGCSSDSSDGESPEPDGNNGSRSFVSQCGTVFAGVLQNPVQESDGELVTITDVAGPNRLIVQRSGGAQLVFLAGLANSVNSFIEDRARSYLRTQLGQAIFYEADSNCSVSLGGGVGTIGTLYSFSNGANLSEELLKRGAALPSFATDCATAPLANCFDAIAEENVVIVGARVSNFLWKPNADRDNNLVVLLNPFAARVVVNGTEELVPSGPSNGRVTTARGNRPGCAYGGNVRIEAFDSAGRPLVWPGEATEFTIGNGCNRVEF
jgi:hypothetical protein